MKFDKVNIEHVNLVIQDFKEKGLPQGFKVEAYMMVLGWSGYTGMGLRVDQVKVILEKCIRENKYFKVWDMKWKGPGSMPCD